MFICELVAGKKIIGEQERGRKKFIGWQLLAGDKQRAIVWEEKYSFDAATYTFKIYYVQIFLRQIFLEEKGRYSITETNIWESIANISLKTAVTSMCVI